jgi:sulfatase maturation enzyme AslB (radical SAM superfamily)
MKPNGDLRICCQSSQGPNKGLLRDETGRVYNLNRDSLTSSRNAALVKDVRVSLLKGEKHPECRRCWEEEDAGIKSRRLQSLEYMNYYDKVVDMTAPDGSIPEDTPYYDYDVRFGNLCNLKCRMCGPTDSSMWYDDHIKLYGNTEFINDTDMRWYERPEIWEDFDQQMHNIKYMYIIGGEPTLIQKHFEFLERCVKDGYAENLWLEYSTNVTNIQQKYLDIWSHFKHVHIGCSVDGVGRVNDYIRFPSKWKVIDRNLSKLADSPKNMRVVLAHTVNAYNIYYLDDIYRWNAQNYNFVISPHTLYRPTHFSTTIFPQYVKEKIAEKLRSFYPWITENNPKTEREDKSTARIIRHIEGHINFMMGDTRTQELKEFWETTHKLDEIRKESIEDSLPELYDLIKDTEFRNFY